ncbi:MAG: outer membrane beta-barrel protein [Vicingaceae bacterium]|nr:outer membrane beta-barrel protein [Vicingaceae bacterium]
MNYAKIVLSLNFYIICLTTYSQHTVGVNLAGGWSKISTEINSSNLTQDYTFMPSYQGGLSYNFHFNNKSIIGAELLFSKIRGQEHSKSPTTDEFGNPTGQLIIGNVDRHISYLSIPVYYGLNYKKLTVNIGVQTSFVISSSDLATTSAPDGNGNMLYFETKSDKMPIKNFDFGARAGLSFSLTNNITIESFYYYGLLNIHEGNTRIWKWSIQQLAVGIKYNFINHKN